jgi:hypothetical protein
MLKLISIITAAAFISLVSCIPPDPPPPRFRQDPPFAPEEVAPFRMEDDVSPPPSQLSEPSQPAPPPPTANGGYPTATSTANPDQVLSPYEPYNVIDISGPPHFKSGQLARDPSNQKIFRVP